MDTIIKQIMENGYYIIENYLDKDTCDRTIKDMNNNLKNFEKIKITHGGNDLRCAQFQKYNRVANRFLHDLEIHNIFEKMLGREIKKKRCQAGIVNFSKNETICSGGGWHVDNHNLQLKAMIYLSDVDETKGPFLYVNKTQQLVKILPNSKGDESGTRFDEYIVKEHVLMKDKKIKELCGKAGTCILFRSDNIHRGKTIEEGARYTLTNYYY